MTGLFTNESVLLVFMSLSGINRVGDLGTQEHKSTGIFSNPSI